MPGVTDKAGSKANDPLGRPGSQPGEKPAQQLLTLPQSLDLTQAQALRDTLTDLADHGAVALDASSVERMSTPCVQVLLAAGRASAPFKILNASDAFKSALVDLGLQQTFSKWVD